MPWFRVDDTFAFHSKVVAAGNDALGLWVRAGSWSAQTLTEGKVPDHMVAALGGVETASRLVEMGLWERLDDGYLFHDWDKYQPSKAAVEAERDAARERQRRAREKAKSLRDDKPNEPVSHNGSNGVSHGVTQAGVTVPPSLPIPTHPIPVNDAPRKRSNGTRLKADWMPDPDVIEAMKAECPGLDFAGHHKRFVDYWISKPGQGGVKLDWNATWRNWMRTAHEGRPAATQLRTVPAYETPPMRELPPEAS